LTNTARKIFAGIAVTMVVGAALTGAAGATNSAHGHAGTAAQATKEWRVTMVGTNTKEW